MAGWLCRPCMIGPPPARRRRRRPAADRRLAPKSAQIRAPGGYRYCPLLSSDSVAGGGVEHIGSRSAMVNNVGLLCLIIDGAKGSVVRGWIRLQKAAYFCQYLGWPRLDYKLDYYGPSSLALAETVADAESAGLIRQDRGNTSRFSLTDAGREVLGLFVEEVCDRGRADKTRRLARLLSVWPSTDLEIAATLDYVANGERMSKGDLLDKVRSIRPTRRRDSIARAYAAWKRLVREMDIPIESVRW